jgi:hypothetical protein
MIQIIESVRERHWCLLQRPICTWTAFVRLLLACLVCCFALDHGTARAAEIKAAPIAALPDTALITVSGVLETSDAERFRAAVAMYPKAIVAFQSTGGSLTAGIDIGMQIRLRNYMTLVPSGVLCASACATAWLGGTRRLMGPGALIGFHAAYVDQNGQAIETGVGNALLGAYLNKLGLPDRAIVFITQAHPNDLTRLTMADAARVGIDVSLFTMAGTPPSRPVARPMPQTPDAPTAFPNAPILPSAISPQYSNEDPGDQRMHTCLDQYIANKQMGANGGLLWIQRGGGYYSECNKHLKGID